MTHCRGLRGIGIVVAAAGAIGGGTAARGQATAPVQGPPSSINRPFESPDLDVGAFVKRYENESREVFAKRTAIVEALGIKPGMGVADIGAGTGLFTRLFADKVGAEGKVYAVEIAPALLKHIASEAKANKLDRVITTVLATQESSQLPPNSVDLVFLCDTYHHIEHPTPTLESIRRALRPGGRIAIIDFDRHEQASDFVKGHVRAGKEVFFKEIESAGFDREAAPTVDLKENFFAVFRKREVGAASTEREEAKPQ